jgi:hypothetical protein
MLENVCAFLCLPSKMVGGQDNPTSGNLGLFLWCLAKMWQRLLCFTQGRQRSIRNILGLFFKSGKQGAELQRRGGRRKTGIEAQRRREREGGRTRGKGGEGGAGRTKGENQARGMKVSYPRERFFVFSTLHQRNCEEKGRGEEGEKREEGGKEGRREGRREERGGRRERREGGRKEI